MANSNSKNFWNSGECLVWASSLSLTTILLLITTLIGIVLLNSLDALWTKPVAKVVLKDGSSFLGEITQHQKEETTSIDRIQLKIGNRDLYGFDFKWVDVKDIVESSEPEDAIVFERASYGNFYGYLASVHGEHSHEHYPHLLHEAFENELKNIEPLVEEKESIQKMMTSLSDTLEHAKYKLLDLRYKGIPEDSKNIRKQLDVQGATKEEFSTLNEQLLKIESQLAQYYIEAVDTQSRKVTIKLAHIVRSYHSNQMGVFDKLAMLFSRVHELVWEEPRESNTEGGLFPAIFGTVMLVFLMSILSFPLGVITAVYLREYAKDGPVLRVVRIAVNNLAGVPSIVYGIFGLAFFVYGIGGFIDQTFFPERLPTPTWGTGGILWASLTLGLLTVPVVVVSTEEALSSIPGSMRESSFSLGATKFQTLYRILLPMASPGIMTGFILAMTRAVGEVAPLMLTGVVKLAPANPIDGSFPFAHFERKFMHLGFHIYDIGFQSPNIEATKPFVYLTTLLLVFIIIVLCSTVIYLRNRMSKKYAMKGF